MRFTYSRLQRARPVVTRFNDPDQSITYDLIYGPERPSGGPIWGIAHTWSHMVRVKGFGLLDVIVTLVIVTLLASLAVPAFEGYSQRARVAAAMGDIGSMSLEIEQFRRRNNGRIPLTREELGAEIPVDPWGQPYEYLNIVAAGPGNSALRKDGKLNPLNTDYDLYSIGRDGQTTGPLSAQHSRDDIVRANNGAFIGLGEDY